MSEKPIVLNTLNGPLVKHENRYVTLLEPHLLIDIAEEHPSILSELVSQIATSIRDGADEVIDALYSDVQMYPAKITANLTAAAQFTGFIQSVWEPYQNAKIGDITES